MIFPCLRLYYFNFKDMIARRCKFDDVFNSLNIDDHAAAEQKTNFRYGIVSIIITMGQ